MIMKTNISELHIHLQSYKYLISNDKFQLFDMKNIIEYIPDFKKIKYVQIVYNDILYHYINNYIDGHTVNYYRITQPILMYDLDKYKERIEYIYNSIKSINLKTKYTNKLLVDLQADLDLICI